MLVVAFAPERACGMQYPVVNMTPPAPIMRLVTVVEFTPPSHTNQTAGGRSELVMLVALAEAVAKNHRIRINQRIRHLKRRIDGVNEAKGQKDDCIPLGTTAPSTPKGWIASREKRRMDIKVITRRLRVWDIMRNLRSVTQSSKTCQEVGVRFVVNGSKGYKVRRVGQY
jgi:hypothetical protein